MSEFEELAKKLVALDHKRGRLAQDKIEVVEAIAQNKKEIKAVRLEIAKLIED